MIISFAYLRLWVFMSVGRFLECSKPYWYLPSRSLYTWYPYYRGAHITKTPHRKRRERRKVPWISEDASIYLCHFCALSLKFSHTDTVLFTVLCPFLQVSAVRAYWPDHLRWCDGACHVFCVCRRLRKARHKRTESSFTFCALSCA